MQSRTYQFTVDDFHRMAEAGVFAEDDRVELLDGAVVAMTPVGPGHAASVERLVWEIRNRIGDDVSVRTQNPVVLGPHWEPQPGVAVVRFRSDFYRGAHPGPADILLIVEVADSSLEIDQGAKVPGYARAGVPEVWIADLQRRVVHVYRQPAAGGYAKHHVLGVDDRVGSRALPGLDIAVAALV